MLSATTKHHRFTLGMDNLLHQLSYLQYSIVVQVKDRLLVSKQATQKFDVKRLILTKLSEFVGRKQYQIKV